MIMHEVRFLDQRIMKEFSGGLFTSLEAARQQLGAVARNHSLVTHSGEFAWIEHHEADKAADLNRIAEKVEKEIEDSSEM